MYCSLIYKLILLSSESENGKKENATELPSETLFGDKHLLKY